MPGWEFDRRTGTMIPKKATGLEFHMTNGGLKVIDNDLNTSFIILRSNDSIGYAQGIAGIKGVKLYDYNKAQRIAERVKRCLPASQYTDYRKFCRGVNEKQMSDEDKALLETLVNGYKGNSLNEALNELDYTVGVLNPKSSDGQTRGAQDHGAKKQLHGLGGFVKALPSLAISFLICPPMAIIKLLGAVRVRTEKRWLRSLFNTNTWEDFIATPYDKKEELKNKMEEQLKRKTQYYYTELANGEILKVPACSKIEARDMILAIEREDIEKRYANYNKGYSHIAASDDGNDSINTGLYDESSTPPSFYSSICYKSEESPCKMWVIKFTDGQASYAFGLDGERDKIMEEALETKKGIVEYYKKIVLKSKDGDDNKEDKKMKHLGIGKDDKDGHNDSDYQDIDELFAPPQIDDMIEIKNIAMYSPITEYNEKDFSEPSTSPMTWTPRLYPTYVFNFGLTNDKSIPAMITFNLPASKDDEAGTIMTSISNGLLDFIQKETNTINELYNPANENLKGIISQEGIYNSIFNIVCIDNRNRDGDGKVIQGYDDEKTNRYKNCILFSDLKNTIRIIEEALRNAYSDATLEKGIRNEYNTSYMNSNVVHKTEFELKNDSTIKWNNCWTEVINKLQPKNKVEGEIIKKTGNEKIRQNVTIQLIRKAA